MASKADYGIEFVNIEIKFDLALIAEDEEILSLDDLFLWAEQASRNFMKFGMSYNERSSSYTVSVTDKGALPPSEKPPCITQHGKSLLSAFQKCYFLIEVCGDGRVFKSAIEHRLQQREDVLSEQLAGLLKKRT